MHRESRLWDLGLSVWSLGANSIVATSGSLTGSPVMFIATGTAGAPGALTIVGGDGQTVVAGSAVTIAPSVKVTLDENGNVVAGATVMFSVTAGNGMSPERSLNLERDRHRHRGQLGARGCGRLEHAERERRVTHSGFVHGHWNRWSGCARRCKTQGTTRPRRSAWA